MTTSHFLRGLLMDFLPRELRPQDEVPVRRIRREKGRRVFVPSFSEFDKEIMSSGCSADRLES